MESDHTFGRVYKKAGVDAFIYAICTRFLFRNFVICLPFILNIFSSTALTKTCVVVIQVSPVIILLRLFCRVCICEATTKKCVGKKNLDSMG